MTELLDWNRVERGDLAAASIASFLRRGAVVAFPTESAYIVAGAALVPGILERLQQIVGARPLSLLLPATGAVRDWLPGLSTTGLRFAQRFWPGPLTLAGCDGLEHGLLTRLPQHVAHAVVHDDCLHLTQPGHEALAEVMRRMPGPVLAGALRHGERDAFSTQEALVAAGNQLDLLIAADTSLHQPSTLVEVRGHDWSVRQEGAIPAEELRGLLATLIVFVCTGNTCRSPMAEVLCKRRLAQRLGCAVEDLAERGYQVLSAGLAAGPGSPAADQAIEVVRRFDADLTSHQSRPLTSDLLSRADHLFVMTHGHLRALQGQRLAGGGRPRLLSPHGEDVSDPIGGSRELYEACARQLDAYIAHLVDRVLMSPENTR